MNLACEGASLLADLGDLLELVGRRRRLARGVPEDRVAVLEVVHERLDGRAVGRGVELPAVDGRLHEVGAARGGHRGVGDLQVTLGLLVPLPSWSELPLAGSVVTASQEAEAAGTPIARMSDLRLVPPGVVDAVGDGAAQEHDQSAASATIMSTVRRSRLFCVFCTSAMRALRAPGRCARGGARSRAVVGVGLWLRGRLVGRLLATVCFAGGARVAGDRWQSGVP